MVIGGGDFFSFTERRICSSYTIFGHTPSLSTSSSSIHGSVTPNIPQNMRGTRPS